MRVVLAGAGASVVAAFLILPALGFTWMPDFDGGEFNVNFRVAPGSRFRQTATLARLERGEVRGLDAGRRRVVRQHRHRAAVRARLLRSDHVRAGPGSITWKVNREVIMVASWGRAILLQLDDAQRALREQSATPQGNVTLGAPPSVPRIATRPPNANASGWAASVRARWKVLYQVSIITRPSRMANGMRAASGAPNQGPSRWMKAAPSQ